MMFSNLQACTRLRRRCGTSASDVVAAVPFAVLSS